MYVVGVHAQVFFLLILLLLVLVLAPQPDGFGNICSELEYIREDSVIEKLVAYFLT